MKPENPVDAALRGEIDTKALNEEQHAEWLDRFVDKMSKPSAEELEFFKQRRLQASSQRSD